MGTVQYKNRKLRLVVSFLASFYMLVHGKPFDIGRALSSPGFYVVLAFSFFIAILLVEIVNKVSITLDKKYGWRSMYFARTALQIVFGIFFPALIDLGLVSIYFNILGEDIVDNGYFYIDFPVVVGFLIILNFYYCFHYWILTDQRNVAKQLKLVLATHIESKDTEDELLMMEHKGRRIYFKIHDILYFYRSGKVVKFRAEDDSEHPVNYTIGKLSERYADKGFVRINRGMVINSRIIIGYKVGPRKNTLQLILHETYNKVVSDLGIEQFQVTKEFISHFKSILPK
ncbi:LytTR family DNA-binding domain-containing protein [Sphingobacterium siyangense]|uniref:LytTR family DNA-binding domain-containing protein n=1 Tax=Sphingobacterium siyangense TaxID=459529 RepID=UPI00196597DD|nr:LytTR family DNA-binding domain-containing protein [Sphingobacterium siyangense]QRY55560.1 LytTR family transcriptional regulator [Sphingobacterium siyangense]